MAIKTQYVVYTAKNFTTGLTDVTANVFKDGSSVAVATGLALAEISAGDAEGRYRLTLSPTQINSFGGVGVYTIVIDSSSKSAPATAKLTIVANDNDDLDAKLDVLDGKLDTITSNLATAQADITSIKSTVESTNNEVVDPTSGLSALKALIDSVQAGVTSIQNATRTVVALPNELISPPTGTESYKVQIRIYDLDGNLEDPDSNSVQVSLSNSAGLDRGNLFQGGGASPKAATRLGQGRYEIDLEIPAGQTKEQINMIVDYTENTIPLQAVRSSNVVDQIQASGLAQQVTLQEVLDDTSVMQPQVADIQSKVNDAGFGLSALKSALDALDLLVSDNNTILNSGTIGNQAIINAIADKASQTSLNNLIADVDLVKGTGFDTATDSLKQISDRQFTGGSAV
jgi:hypothetical protein